MKFIYMGDAHEHTEVPRCRLDDFKLTREEKTKEIRELAKEHGAKAILQGGDFLSSPKYGTQFLVEILNRWGYKVHNEVLLEEGAITNTNKEVPLVGPIGNHELFGMSHRSYEKTSLYFLERNGFITMPTKENPLIFTSDEGFTVAITVGHYEEGMDNSKEPYIVEEKKGDYHIHIVHGMLTKGKYFEDAPHTTIDDIKDTKADLTIAGHDHVGFGAVEVDGKIFVNPGSPFRLTAGEIKRKPKVLLIDITKEKGLKIKNIYLKSAKDGEEVINPDVEEFKKERKSVLEEARERVGGNRAANGDINDIINSMAETNNIRECIKDKAIARIADRIDNSKSKLSENNSNFLGQPYYIKRLVLENFGSHEYSNFEFSPGMNVFIGATSSGKTTILRAFRWLYDDYGNSKRFIKKGSQEAKVTIYTSHGYVITRFCHIKKATRNGFEIIYPDGHKETLNTKGIKVVQDILSYSKLDLETKKIDLNFLSQGSSWFFIGEDYSSGDRAKIIGSIYKTHIVDLAIKDLELESRKLAQRKEDKVKTLAGLQEQIDDFKFLEVMKENIDKLDLLEEKLLEKFNKKNKIEELNAKKENIEVKIKSCEEILNILSVEDLDKLKNILSSLNSNYSTLNKLKPLSEKMKNTEYQIKVLEDVLNLVPRDNIDSLKDLLINIKDKFSSFKNIKVTNDNLNRVNDEIVKLDEILGLIDVKKLDISKTKLDEVKAEYKKIQDIVKLSNKVTSILSDVNQIKKIQDTASAEKISSLNDKVASIKEKSEKANKIVELLQKRGAILADVEDMKKNVDMANNKLAKEVEIYKALLVKNEKCPICNSKITAAVADKIANEKIANNIQNN